jgi:hypothetical protein
MERQINFAAWPFTGPLLCLNPLFILFIVPTLLTPIS